MNDMKDPEWATILDEFYKQNGWMYRVYLTNVKHPDLPDKHDVDNYYDVMGEEIPLNMLLTSGLIETKEPGELGARPATPKEGVQWYRLTETGFSVAHDRYMNKQEQNLIKTQNLSNRLIAVFTVLLALTAVIQAISQILSLNEYRLFLSIIYIALALVAMVIASEVFSE